MKSLLPKVILVVLLVLGIVLHTCQVRCAYASGRDQGYMECVVDYNKMFRSWGWNVEELHLDSGLAK